MSNAWRAASAGQRNHWRKRVRPAVLERDGGMCQLKYPGVWSVRVREGDHWVNEDRCCAGVADQVHHTLGKAAGDDPAYCLAACGPCNRRAGDPTKHTDKMREVVL